MDADEKQKSHNVPNVQLPIVNCHSHIFTGDYVPPLLGLGLIWFPFNILFNVRWLISVVRWVYPFIYPYDALAYRSGPGGDIEEGPDWRQKTGAFVIKVVYSIRSAYSKYWIVPRIWWVVQAWLGLIVIRVILDWINVLNQGGTGSSSWAEKILNWVFHLPVMIELPESLAFTIPFVIFVLLFARQARQLVVFTFSKLKGIPGKLSTELLKKYWQLGEYAKYRQQHRILDRMKDQYPEGSRFVILPMDMKYMGAGKLRSIPAEYKQELKAAKADLAEAREAYEKAVSAGEKETVGVQITRLSEMINMITHSDPYLLQLKKLADIKRNREDQVEPFLFIDPRRIVESRADKNTKSFFEYEIRDGKVSLHDCIVKDYMEGEARFSGFKIYPALGYYPFDPELLPLWRYAAENQIPIMTHCVRGTIFFRGYKRVKWHRHPVFHYSRPPFDQLLLKGVRSKDYTINFTHPLNFLCLLEEELLRECIGKQIKQWESENAKNANHDELESKIRQLTDLFGFKGFNKPLTFNLTQLKICLGHYGGDEHWAQFLASDRQDQSRTLVTRPWVGINLAHTDAGKLSWEKLQKAWYETDWYAIISSMMLKYPNVYADISYILHNEDIFPLLKRTLRHRRNHSEAPDILPSHSLGERVLFGTDFYMVRSHKTEKEILSDHMAQLTMEEFDLIARKNPETFLNHALKHQITLSNTTT